MRWILILVCASVALPAIYMIIRFFNARVRKKHRLLTQDQIESILLDPSFPSWESHWTALISPSQRCRFQKGDFTVSEFCHELLLPSIDQLLDKGALRMERIIQLYTSLQKEHRSYAEGVMALVLMSRNELSDENRRKTYESQLLSYECGGSVDLEIIKQLGGKKAEVDLLLLDLKSCTTTSRYLSDDNMRYTLSRLLEIKEQRAIPVLIELTGQLSGHPPTKDYDTASIAMDALIDYGEIALPLISKAIKEADSVRYPMQDDSLGAYLPWRSAQMQSENLRKVLDTIRLHQD